MSRDLNVSITVVQPSAFFTSERQLGFEINWADRHGVPAESLAQYRHESREGYRLPDMATNFRTWCAACAWLEAQSAPVVVKLPPMHQGAGIGGRLVSTLAKSMHAEYVKAIEAAGAKVVQ